MERFRLTSSGEGDGVRSMLAVEGSLARWLWLGLGESDTIISLRRNYLRRVSPLVFQCERELVYSQFRCKHLVRQKESR